MTQTVEWTVEASRPRRYTGPARRAVLHRHHADLQQRRFLGLNGVEPLDRGKKTFFVKGHDAGREAVTEKPLDIVERGILLGPVFP
jgi:hypothetical protein